MAQSFKFLITPLQVITVWNQDGGTSSQQAYKCVPFYLSNRGYGIFINHPGEVELEIGVEKASRVGISVVGQELEYFVIYGPTPLQVISSPSNVICRTERFSVAFRYLSAIHY